MKTVNLNGLMINGDGFAFDPRNGQTYNINATGLVVIEGLKNGLSDADIQRAVVEQFDVDTQTVSRDMEAFMNELKRQRLIEDEVVS